MWYKSLRCYCVYFPAPVMCNNSGSVAVLQKDIITVKGESIVLQCLFKGNLKVLWPSMTSYWMIRPHGQNTKPLYIMNNSTDSYHIAVYQTCLSEDGSCCNFTNKLYIQDVQLEFNKAHLECGVAIDGVMSSHTVGLG